MKFLKKAIDKRWGMPLIAGATALVLGGCCTSSHKSAYVEPAPVENAGGEAQPPATTTESYREQPSTVEAQPNTVIPLWKEDLKVGKREVEVGSVRLQKTVKERTEQAPLDLNQQEIVIERKPGTTQAQPQGQAFQNGEIVIPLKREEPVVEIEKVPAGEVTVHTRTSTEHTNVTAQVRREDVAVSKQGDTQNVIDNEAAGGAETPAGQASGGAASSEVITDPGTFATADPATLTGRPVRVSGLKVQRVVGKLFVLQGPNGQPLYVVVKGQPPANINQGDTVQIQGTCEQPGANESSMGLNAQDTQALNSQRCYIAADNIQPANQ